MSRIRGVNEEVFSTTHDRDDAPCVAGGESHMSPLIIHEWL